MQYFLLINGPKEYVLQMIAVKQDDLDYQKKKQTVIFSALIGVNLYYIKNHQNTYHTSTCQNPYERRCQNYISKVISLLLTFIYLVPWPILHNREPHIKHCRTWQHLFEIELCF